MAIQLSGLVPLSATNGTLVDVYGASFASDTALYVGNTQMTVDFIDPGHLQFVIPAPACFQGGAFDNGTFYTQSSSIFSLTNTCKVSVVVANSDGTTDNWEGFVLHFPNVPPANALSYLNTPGQIPDFAEQANPNPVTPAPPMGQQSQTKGTVQPSNTTTITNQGMVYNQPKYVISVQQAAITTTSQNNETVTDTAHIQADVVKFVDLAPKKILSEVLS